MKKERSDLKTVMIIVVGTIVAFIVIQFSPLWIYLIFGRLIWRPIEIDLQANQQEMVEIAQKVMADNDGSEYFDYSFIDLPEHQKKYSYDGFVFLLTKGSVKAVVFLEYWAREDYYYGYAYCEAGRSAMSNIAKESSESGYNDLHNYKCVYELERVASDWYYIKINYPTLKL